MDNQAVKTRSAEIDMMRGCAAILVAVGHLTMISSPENFIYRWMFSFHMPCFFFLAGYCTSPARLEISFPVYLRKLFCRLLVPCIVFRLFIAATELWQKEELLTFPTVANEVLFRLQHPGVEWFLPCMFTGLVLLYLFVFITKNRPNTRDFSFTMLWGIVAIMLTPIFCKLYGAIVGHELLFPVYIDSMSIGFAFILLGFLYRNYVSERLLPKLKAMLSANGSAKAVNILLFLALGVVCVLYLVRNSYAYVNIAWAKMGDSEMMFYLVALYWIAVLYLGMRGLCRIKALSVVKRFLCFSGKYSLQVYLGHAMIDTIYKILYTKWGGGTLRLLCKVLGGKDSVLDTESDNCLYDTVRV